jgi:hypothetical protein
MCGAKGHERARVQRLGEVWRSLAEGKLTVRVDLDLESTVR